MSGTLYFVFILAALVCVVAGLAAVSRTRRASREDPEEEVYPEMTYAEEQAAVAAAEAAEAEQRAGAHDDGSRGEGEPSA